MTQSYTQDTLIKLSATVNENYIFGQEEILKSLMVAFLARGHVLVEGPPGTAKTMSAKILAHCLGKEFRRIQFTSDLLPSDILGSFLYTGEKNDFKFVKGPIFADFIVADEINRAPPRTQSALLEAMEERQVTVEGQCFPLHQDFFVMATQNPSDFEGTFPLPEVQLDRFLMKLRIDHVDQESEIKILSHVLAGTLPPDYPRLARVDWDRPRIEAELKGVKVDESILRYVSQLLGQLREHAALISASSIRGGIALVKCARLWALLEGRDFVIPDDVRALAVPTLAHRLHLNPEARMSELSAQAVLQEVLSRLEFPK